VGRVAPGALRSWGLDQGVDAPHWAGANTIRSALRSEAPPGFRCPERPSKLDPFKEEIHDLLRGDPKLTGVRVRELIEPLGFDGGKSIVDDYLREVRPLFVRTRTHQRTLYRPGEICQWDLCEPLRESWRQFLLSV
jgi:hypothetical protein